MNKRHLLAAALLTIVACYHFARAQDESWTGQRIVTLKGFGDYFITDDNGRPKLVSPEGLGVNIVAAVQRVEGDRVWLKANGGGDAAVGWVNRDDAIRLHADAGHIGIDQRSIHADKCLVVALVVSCVARPLRLCGFGLAGYVGRLGLFRFVGGFFD